MAGCWQAASPPLWRQRDCPLLWTGQAVSTWGSHAPGIGVAQALVAAADPGGPPRSAGARSRRR